MRRNRKQTRRGKKKEMEKEKTKQWIREENYKIRLEREEKGKRENKITSRREEIEDKQEKKIGNGERGNKTIDGREEK